jgi:putative oxidoreductase
MAGSVFLWEGILKFVYANQGIGRFTKLGMPLPHCTADLVACLEIVGGPLLLFGLLTRPIAVPFVVEMIVAILSTKISLYLGTSPLPLPVAGPKVGMWAVLHEVRCEYAQLLTVLFLMINGPGKWSLGAVLGKQKTRESRSGRSRAAPEGVRKRVGTGIADHVLILRPKESAQPVGVHDVLAGHVGNRLGWNG